jgi:hypothetical protein
MAIEVNKAKEKLSKAETDLKQMTSLNKVCIEEYFFHFPDCVFRPLKRL